VVVEFAVNDNAGALGQLLNGDTYEGLVRQLLDAPSHPAVILVFMMRYQAPPIDPSQSAQSWQSVIGAYYNLPMVSYFDAIGTEMANGNITVPEITGDDIHPNDLGHAYAAQFIEQNLQIAMANFPSGTALENIPATPAPLETADFEFTSLQDDIGTGNGGTPLSPVNNQGWTLVPSDSNPIYGSNAGLDSSTPGSTLDFTVTGREIVIGWWLSDGPMGEVSVTVDGVPMQDLYGFQPNNGGQRYLARVVNGLQSGLHAVHVELLSTVEAGSTGTDFRFLCIGTGGVQ
jgi:hypothetical protein